MAFCFSLESLLRLRSSLERQEQARLQLASQRMFTAQAQCESLAKERIELENKFRVLLQAGIASAELYFHLSGRSGLDSVQADAARTLAEARKQWNEQRNKYLQSRRDREVISSVRDRQHREYLVQQARHEQQEIDDLFAMRRLHQNG
jgi:flagellar export protein FliJ